MLRQLNFLCVRQAFNQCRWASLNVAESRVSSFVAQPPFHFITSCVHTLPPLSLLRRIMGPFNRQLYRSRYEDEYSEEGFMRGAKQSLLLCAMLLREEKFSELIPIMSTALVREIKLRVEEAPIDVMREKLTFSEDDIVHSFIHHSVFSTSSLLPVPAKSKTSFYSTFVFYVDKLNSNDKDRPLKQIMKSSDPFLIGKNRRTARPLEDYCRQLRRFGVCERTEFPLK